jgi:hypothetical protein
MRLAEQASSATTTPPTSSINSGSLRLGNDSELGEVPADKGIIMRPVQMSQKGAPREWGYSAQQQNELIINLLLPKG